MIQAHHTTKRGACVMTALYSAAELEAFILAKYRQRVACEAYTLDGDGDRVSVGAVWNDDGWKWYFDQDAK